MVTFKIARAALVLAALTALGCAGEGDGPPASMGTGGTMTPDAGTTADADPLVTCSPATDSSVALSMAQLKGLSAPNVSISASEPDPTSAACLKVLASVQKLAAQGNINATVTGAGQVSLGILYDCQGNDFSTCDNTGVLTAKVAVVGDQCVASVTGTLVNAEGGGPTKNAAHLGCNIDITTTVAL